MKTQQWLKILGISLLLVGCGGGDTASTETAQNSVTVPTTYNYKVINNRGLAVEGTMDNYTIKIYSTTEEVADPKSMHKGVVVTINGKASEVMPIQISYLNKEIVVAVENEKGEQVAVSDAIEVTDVPVVVVELSI
ncbi:hypothetical protein KKC13_03395 [bacterium]|nr:hypothetical protein [bacterium]MBU1957388.1 hypothetical protein [bacterium]